MSDSDENDNIQDEEIENGHVSSSISSTNYMNSSSDDDDDGQGGEFNIDLPTSHRYLGRLNDLGGYTLFDDWEVLTMIAIDTNTLVMPGFTLPLVFEHRGDSSIMQHFLENRKVFVLLRADHQVSCPEERFDVGVTMEVVEKVVKDECLYLKARGRQRCQIVPKSEVKPLTDRLQKVTVEILPEYKITSPLVDSQLQNLKKRSRLVSETFDELLRARKYRKYHAAQFTYPEWLYEEYETCYYVKHISSTLKKYFEMEFVPKDPTILSYWFIQNYLLQNEERLQLLKQNTVIGRLMLEMKFLKDNRLILCHNCNFNIAEQRDLILLSKDGVQNNYVNPGGHVFETLTVGKAKNFILVGRPSKKFTWFPGYYWTIMNCQRCKMHLGWKFTSSTLTPKEFFGLARSCVLVTNEQSNH